MKTWPQRQRFRELADAKIGLGVTKEAQAEGIGIEVSSFTTYYSGKGREPGKKTLQRMASYYGVALSELVDDPGAELPGVPAKVMQRLTPAKRMVLRSIADHLASPLVTDEASESIWKAIEALVAIKTR